MKENDLITFDYLPTAVTGLINEVKALRELLTAPTETAPPPTEYLHSIQELANFLGCSAPTAQNIKNSGKIRYKQFGRKLIFSTSEILEDLGKSTNKKSR